MHFFSQWLWVYLGLDVIGLYMKELGDLHVCK